MGKIFKTILSLGIVCLLAVIAFGQNNGEKTKECSIKLDVEFLNSGYIGEVLPVSNSCEKGSFENEAIEKAKKLEFVIAIKNDEPVTIKKTVEFKYQIAENNETELVSVIEPITILEKPPAGYPKYEGGGTVCFTGAVRLRVEFLSTGQIGGVKAISELPYGATENAIEAAKKMKFVPMKENGISKSVVKVVVYSFRLY